MCCVALARLRAGLHAAKRRTGTWSGCCGGGHVPQNSSVTIHWGHGGKRGKKKGFREDSIWNNPKESPFRCDLRDYALAIQYRNPWHRATAYPEFLHLSHRLPGGTLLLLSQFSQYFCRKWVVYTLTWRLLWFCSVRNFINKLKLPHDI